MFCFKSVRLNITKNNSYHRVFLTKKIAIRNTTSNTSIKPYDDIPKVRGLPLIGTLKDYITMPGGISNLHHLYDQRLNEYGPIYREKIGLEEECIYTANPDDFETIYKSEKVGEFIDRGKALWSFSAYTKKHNLPDNMLLMKESDFQRRKESIKKAILMPKEVARLSSMYNEVSKDFVRFLESKREKESNTIKKIEELLFLWSYECAGVTIFRTRLNALDENGILEPAVKQLLEARKTIMESWFNIEMASPQFYHEFLFSKTWKAFEENLNSSYSAAKEIINRYDEHVTDKSSDLSDDERLSTCIDVMGASIDTTAYTALWSLVEISKYPDIQEKMYNEIMKVAPEGNFDHKLVQKMPYLRACLKEVFRKKPLVMTTVRQTKTDLVLSGYQVPANTRILMQNGFTNKVDQIKDPDDFKPERWIKGMECPAAEKTHPFAVLPFGHGVRGCMGRRLAENELYTLYANIFRLYKVKPLQADIKSKFAIIMKPVGELSFVFEKRKYSEI